MKTKNLFLIVIFLMIFSFGITTEKVLADEQNATTPTNESSDDSSVQKINNTTTQKQSPYSLIKERIQELQQKMKVNNEQKIKPQIIDKICSNNMEEIQSYFGGKVFNCNNYYKVVPSINLADAPTVIFDKNGNIVARCDGMPLPPGSEKPDPKECSLSCESKILCIITPTTTKEINARKQPLINAVKSDVKENVEVKKQEIQDKREEIKQKLTENSIKRIRAYTERIVNRFMAVIERFEIMSKRIETRIQKIEDGGIKLDEAKTKLKDANEKIASAKTKVGEIVTKIEEVLISETPKEMFGQSKEVFKTVEDLIKETHKSLVEVITIVKNFALEFSDTNSEATTTQKIE
ncbi:MAG: hypothetical protein WC849_02560 [Candidatus Paceibacterota bacterium]